MKGNLSHVIEYYINLFAAEHVGTYVIVSGSSRLLSTKVLT